MNIPIEKSFVPSFARWIQCTALCAAFAAHAAPQTVGDGACPKYAVDIAAFATCVGDRVVVPDAETLPGPPVMLVDDDGNPMPPRVDAIPGDPLALTHRGHYLTVADAYAAKYWLGGSVLFIDVRSAASVRETGLPENVDINLPLLPPTSGGTSNFVDAVKQVLAGRHLNSTAPILVICEDGRHAAIAAEQLAKANMPNVFVVRGGMLGEKSDGGDALGWIVVRLPMRSVNIG